MLRHIGMSVAFLAALAAAVPGVPAAAQEPDTSEVAKLKAQVEAITQEIERLKLGQEVVVAVADTGALGFGPAASKVYRVRQGVSIGGYGEVLYERFNAEREDGAPSDKTDQIDALRAIVYVGYKFNDKFLFNSEIEFEHASTGKAGEASLEFAYLDYRLTDRFGMRAGLLLIPMGFLNELHEPPIFLGTTRPLTEQQIIPSTWRENGIGVFGTAGPLAYRAYAVNGLDGVSGGFGSSGLRGGRQKGSKAVIEDVAVVGRVDYVGQRGFLVGTSAYLGQSGQNAVVPGDPSRSIGGRTTIWEGHGEYKAHGLDLRGLVALAWVDDVAELNAARGLTGAGSIGERLVGWYVQAGYDVLHRTRSTQQLIPYVRYEELDTQVEVPSTFTANPATDRRVVSLGGAWKPIANIAFKVDYQIHQNEADTGIDQLNVQLGYLF